MTKIEKRARLYRDVLGYRDIAVDKETKQELGWAARHFFFTPLYWVYRIYYFFRNFRERLRNERRWNESPKSVSFKCLGRRTMSMRVVLEELSVLREKSRPADMPPLSFLDLLDCLSKEERDGTWKIPTVGELDAVDKRSLKEDIEKVRLGSFDPATIFIWAIDDADRGIIGYCPFTKAKRRPGISPKTDTLSESLRPFQYKEEFYGYAVSVTEAQWRGTPEVF